MNRCLIEGSTNKQFLLFSHPPIHLSTYPPNPYLRAVKKGEVIKDLEIVDIASNGKALGKVEGQVVFVNGLVPGDVADVQIYKKRRKYAEGRAVDIKVRSEIRTEPRCAHFGTCGGCKWQHMSYDQQLIYKSNHVGENLKKISGVALPEMKKIKIGRAHV